MACATLACAQISTERSTDHDPSILATNEHTLYYMHLLQADLGMCAHEALPRMHMRMSPYQECMCNVRLHSPRPAPSSANPGLLGVFAKLRTGMAPRLRRPRPSLLHPTPSPSPPFRQKYKTTTATMRRPLPLPQPLSLDPVASPPCQAQRLPFPKVVVNVDKSGQWRESEEGDDAAGDGSKRERG